MVNSANGGGVMTAPTRRERMRAATLDEIKQTARQLLIDDGPAAISLRAIAREMGMTAPALYRYFTSHEALLDGLGGDLKDELIGELEQARDAVPPDQVGPGCRPPVARSGAGRSRTPPNSA